MCRFLTKIIYNWSSRNRRLFLVMTTVTCALIVLVWRRPPAHLDLSTLSVRQIAHLRASLFENGSNPGLGGTPWTELNRDFEVFLNGSVGTEGPPDPYTQRKQRSMTQCHGLLGSRWHHPAVTVPAFKDSPIISTKHNMMYCPVGKIGSTYYTRFVISMNMPGPMQSPFNISPHHAGRGRVQSLKDIPKGKQLRFLQNATKIVFGRNPFSRIFSAYIDKLFSPNPYYWHGWGDKAGGKKTRACSSDVTFAQFVSYVVRELHKTDVHLKPASEECLMCDIAYDVIGKLETTKEDLTHLGKVLNISTDFQFTKEYRHQSAMDAVTDSVQSPFSWKLSIRRCISLSEMGQRVWRKLQIRGLIDAQLPYPFKQDGSDLQAMKADKFIKACMDAIKSSTNRDQLKKQKKQAYLEAYKSVSLEDLQKIGKAYKRDFLLFDYNSEPEELFQHRDDILDTEFLNVNKQWFIP